MAALGNQRDLPHDRKKLPCPDSRGDRGGLLSSALFSRVLLAIRAPDRLKG